MALYGSSSHFRCTVMTLTSLIITLLSFCAIVYKQPELPALMLASMAQEFHEIRFPKPEPTYMTSLSDMTKLKQTLEICDVNKPDGTLPKLHGVWHLAREPDTGLFTHIYGAYLDDRNNVGPDRYIRLFGVSMAPLQSQPFCYFWYRNISKAFVAPLNIDDIKDTGRGYSYKGDHYQERMYSCVLPTVSAIPEYVSLTYIHCERPTNIIPVHIQHYDSKLKPVGLCVTVSYGRIDPHRLIEWIEFNKLLGISGIRMYNSSITGPANHVLSHYATDGYMTVLPSAPPMSDWCPWCQKLSAIPVLNDCLYHSIQRYKYILVTDLDEYVIPRHHTTIPDLISHLEGLSGLPQPGFMFNNAYFFLDFPLQEDDRINSDLITMQYTLRTATSAQGYAAKSLVNPRRCVVLQNHYCIMRTDDVGTYWTHPVSPDDALCHHYKRCHFNKQDCRRKMMDKYLDISTLRYQQDLVKNTKKITQLLQL